MITGLDHFVLTVRSLEKTLEFYAFLGMRVEVFGENRHALRFGSQKINLHELGREFEPKAMLPTPGSADLCFLVDEDPAVLAARLSERGIPVVEGPVKRHGAQGEVLSVYVRDPDGNLVELARPRYNFV